MIPLTLASQEARVIKKAADILGEIGTFYPPVLVLRPFQQLECCHHHLAFLGLLFSNAIVVCFTLPSPVAT